MSSNDQTRADKLIDMMSFFFNHPSLLVMNDWSDDIMLSGLQLQKAFEMKEKQIVDVYSESLFQM